MIYKIYYHERILCDMLRYTYIEIILMKYLFFSFYNYFFNIIFVVRTL